MAWWMRGNYFETCNCDAWATSGTGRPGCRCSWSGRTRRRATHDRCNVVLGFQVSEGDVDGVDVGGLTFALFADTPAIMNDGGWRVGVLIDERATDQQAAKLAAVATGELGGPPAMFTPMVGERLGVERVPVMVERGDRVLRVRLGDVADFEIENVAGRRPSRARKADSVPHPVNPAMALAPARHARVEAFGTGFERSEGSGFTSTFAWSA